MRIGVIADTHDQLPQEVVELFSGVDHIIHAGDICQPEVIAALRDIAPTTAVRGNNDWAPGVASLPAIEDLELVGHTVRVIHDIEELVDHPQRAGLSCVVSGHSHRPQNERFGATLYFNPGSAGPRRFRLPRSVGFLHLAPTGLEGEVVEFEAAQDG